MGEQTYRRYTNRAIPQSVYTAGTYIDPCELLNRPLSLPRLPQNYPCISQDIDLIIRARPRISVTGPELLNASPWVPVRQ